MRKKIATILLCCIIISCKAQQNFLRNLKKDQPFSSKGYLINLYGENGVWIFQPCPRAKRFVLESLDSRSFLVQDMMNDLGHTYLRDIYGSGKRIAASFYDVTQKREVKDSIEYMYCKLTVHPVGMPSKFKSDKCGYIISYGEVKKGLSCIYFDNYVTAIEPINQQALTSIR
ncbi:hypothetical protein ACTJIJ_09415 [Niabella sp. 22666]|uniref:hypothetical protein n=1 Tax=Niabella sp. 22666 TaxID=3453954 RepID=UPI003F860496